MTRTDTSPQQVAPPRDYGGGDDWADDGDYYVPPDLRPFYAAAEPSPVEKAGYVQHGVSIGQDIQRDVPRVVSHGRDDGEAIVVHESETVTTLVDLAGPSGYRQWLHLVRVRVAQQAKRSADHRALMASYHETCQVCGRRDGSVRIERVHDGGADLVVRCCPTHRPVLVETARQALVARAADDLLDDGRRAGDVAAQVVADLLAPKDGAA